MKNSKLDHGHDLVSTMSGGNKNFHTGLSRDLLQSKELFVENVYAYNDYFDVKRTTKLLLPLV